jgi:hypothetical protein
MAPLSHWPQRATLSIEEAAGALGISRSLAYSEARSGAIAGVPVLRIGARLLVMREPLERLLGADVLAQDGGPPFMTPPDPTKRP